jgi:hypothetical protein
MASYVQAGRNGRQRLGLTNVSASGGGGRGKERKKKEAKVVVVVQVICLEK